MTNDKFKYQIQMPKRSNKNSVKFKFSTEEQNTDHKILKMFQINICQTAKDKQSGSRPKFYWYLCLSGSLIKAYKPRSQK